MAQLLLALYVTATSLGLILLKLGTSSGIPIRIVEGKWHFNLNFFSLSGILLYGLSFLLYIYLISKHDLGYIIPLTTGLVYAIIFVASYFVFHEVFTLVKILGIALIVAGLICLNVQK